jgi:hypothetical protein
MMAEGTGQLVPHSKPADSVEFIVLLFADLAAWMRHVLNYSSNQTEFSFMLTTFFYHA